MVCLRDVVNVVLDVMDSLQKIEPGGTVQANEEEYCATTKRSQEAERMIKAVTDSSASPGIRKKGADGENAVMETTASYGRSLEGGMMNGQLRVEEYQWVGLKPER